MVPSFQNFHDLDGVAARFRTMILNCEMAGHSPAHSHKNSVFSTNESDQKNMITKKTIYLHMVIQEKEVTT